jgi:Lrp/AsnC family transcriptional regulator, leucine-responsive regulatory protein
MNLDDRDWDVMAALQADARLSFNALGRRVGLSQPAVAERVRRLEEAGVITGYHATIDRERSGLPFTAYLRVTCPSSQFQAIRALAIRAEEVIECHHVTGTECFFVKVASDSLARLEQVIERFRSHGEVVPSLVLSTIVEGKPVTPPSRL